MKKKYAKSIVQQVDFKNNIKKLKFKQNYTKTRVEHIQIIYLI